MDQLIVQRAKALKEVRSFFDNRNYIEVDPPTLSPFSSIDCYIDPIETTTGHFLHTSPEYAMKRLLSLSSQNIYFLGHVFRKEETGTLHNTEFTMIEWYKTHTDKRSFLKETEELLFLFLGKLPVEKLSYDQAWNLYAKPSAQIEPSWNEDEIRHYIWATTVEPNLGLDKLTLIYDFPKQDSLLSKTHIVNGKEVGIRFEYYYNKIELANGFFELTDPKEQKKRLLEENQKRILLGKKELPLDHSFIKALKKGLPENTYGIAAGFDRLLMLKTNSPSIQQVQVI